MIGSKLQLIPDDTTFNRVVGRQSRRSKIVAPHSVDALAADRLRTDVLVLRAPGAWCAEPAA